MKKLFYTLLGASLMVAGTALAVNVSVPASSQYGQILIGNATGGSYSTAATSSTKFFTLTTTGSSGAATYSSGTLNIPQYSGGGTPGGASSTIQYNKNSTFGGSTNFVFDGTNVGIGSSTPYASLSLQALSANQVNPLFQVASSTPTTQFFTITGGGDILATGNATGTDAIKIGKNTFTQDDNSIAIGTNANAGNGGNGDSSIAIGNGAIASNYYGVALGRQARATNQSAFAAGNQASVIASNGIAIGDSSFSNSTDGVAIGASAGINTGATGGFALGAQTTITSGALYSISLGWRSNAAAAYCLAIGKDAECDDTNTIVFGSDRSDGTGYNQLYFGQGLTNTAKSDFYVNVTGGSGSNVAAGDLYLGGGRATGNATGGSVYFSTSDVGSSGSTLQSTSTKAGITSTGIFEVASSSPFARLSVHANPTDKLFTSTLFAIGSSTASATTTLFSISNTGSIFTQLSNGCVQAASGILTSTGSNCGAGGGTGLSTTTPIAAGNLLEYSSTGAGSAFGVATTTLAGGGPITVSNSPVVIGASGAVLGCTTAASGVAGCLSNTAFDTFNNKQATLSATWPEILTGATLSFGWATTSQPASSNLWVSNGSNGFYGVATGTVSAGSSAITVTAGRAAIGGALAIDCATAGSGQNGCLSSTDWSTFNGKDSFAWPWTPTNVFGANTNATSTTISFLNGLNASSTVRFGNAGTTTLTWDSKLGALGIGTSSPYAMFALHAASTTGSLVEPTTLFVISSTTAANSTTTLFSIDNTGAASTTKFFGATLTSCTGTFALTWSSGLFTCTAQPQGTVTSIATNNGITGGTITNTGTIGLATINAGVLGAVTNGAVPTSQATSTLFGTGTGGQVLGWLNGVPTWTASSSVVAGAGITVSASGAASTVSIGSNALTLAMFPTIAANTVIGNLTGGTATPTAFATSSLFTGTTGQVGYFGSAGGLVGTSTLFITSGSAVGVGLTTPGAKLEVQATSTTSTGNAFLVWDSAAASLFSVRNDGNVGVGTTSPFAQFSIHAGNGETNTTLFAIGSSTASATTTLFTFSNTGDFNLFDRFGTPTLSVNAASTTGPMFAVFASTTPRATDCTTGVCLFQIDQYGHLTASSTRATPTMSCTPTNNGTVGNLANDVTGEITTGTLSTACTVTFASAYATTPEVFVTGNNTGATVAVTSKSTTAFTISLSTGLTGDIISYFIVQP